MVKVYQVKSHAVTFCSKPLPLPSNLELVAEMDGDLNFAYDSTQHFDFGRPWHEGMPINCKFVGITPPRSTSVGDIMEQDGKIYVVASCGFDEIPDYQLPE